MNLQLNPKNYKKDVRKNILLSKDPGNQVESNLDVDENIVFTTMQKEVNQSIPFQKYEKEMTKLFHIKVYVQKKKLDDLFDSSSQPRLIATNLARKHGLKVQDHPNPYPLGWVNKDVDRGH